jgi:hypothetical protein
MLKNKKHNQTLLTITDNAGMKFCNTIVQKASLLFFLMGIIHFSASAQEWNNEGELEDVEIEIIKERQITLPEADRNYEKIAPRPADPFKPQVTYDFKPLAFYTAPLNPAIKPLKLKQEDPSKIYGGYLSAGYGNYASPYVEAFINSKRDKNKLIGAHGLFSASDKGPVDSKNSGSGLTMLSLFGKTFNDYVAVSGDVGFENRTTHFYGYPEGLEVEAADIKQSYSKFYVKGDLSNAKNSDLTYRIGAGFSYLADKFEARESEVDLGFTLGYKLSDASRLALNSGYNLLNRKDDMVDANPRSLFFVNPRYEFLPIENLKLSAGIVAAIENDSIDSKNVHAYPDIRASYVITPAVQLLASLTGGIEKVSLQTLSNENIWITSNIPIFHTNKLYDLSGAINTKLGNKVSVTGGLSIASLKNWYFFKNIAAGEQFAPDYSPEETIRTNFFGSLTYAKAEQINVLVRADAFAYRVDDDMVEAWHRPTYKVTVDGNFNIVKKILVNMKLIGLGGMKGLDPTDGKTVKLDPALDISARVEYLLSDSFSVFAQLNNLTSTKYPLYFNYPARGFQAMGGLTWKF